MRISKKTVTVIISIIISGILLLALFYNVDFSLFLHTIKDLNIIYLILAVLFYVATFVARAMRLRMILHYKQTMVLVSVSTIHFFFNRLLPFKAGDVALPLMLKKYAGVNFFHGMYSLIFIRFLDIYALLILIFCALNIVKIDTELTSALKIFIAIALLLQSLLLLRIDQTIIQLKKILTFIKIDKLESVIQKAIENLSNFSKTDGIHEWSASKTKFLLTSISSSIFICLLTYLTYYAFLQSFNINFNIFEVILGASGAMLLNILPINTPGRLGVFEAGWAAGFIFFLHLDKDLAIPIALSLNIWQLLFNGILALIGYIYLSTTHNKIMKLEGKN